MKHDKETVFEIRKWCRNKYTAYGSKKCTLEYKIGNSVGFYSHITIWLKI